MRRDATRLTEDVIGSSVEELLGDVPRRVEPEVQGNGRKATPHEQGRKARKITVTLPSAAWRQAIVEEALCSGVRVCDIVTYAFSYYRAAVERGETTRPRGEADYGQRAGDNLDLPWKPE